MLFLGIGDIQGRVPGKPAKINAEGKLAQEGIIFGQQGFGELLSFCSRKAQGAVEQNVQGFQGVPTGRLAARGLFSWQEQVR
jgi:hypothetical protein